MKPRTAWLQILPCCLLVLLLNRSGNRAIGQNAAPAPHIQVHATASGAIKSLAFAADNRTLVITEDKNVSLWDVQTGSELRSLADQGDTADANSLHDSAISSDGQLLVTATRALNFWDLT